MPARKACILDVYKRQILKCIGKEVGIATDNPKVLTYACVIRGKEEIEKELLHGNGKQDVYKRQGHIRMLWCMSD